MARGERGTARPYLRGATWWIRYSVPGESRERFESSKSSDKRVALRLLHGRQKDVDERRIGPTGVTVGQLLGLYLQDQRVQKRAAYRSAEGFVRLHLQPAFGRLAAEKLTTGEITDFIVKKQKEGYTNSSINRWLEALRRGWRLGQDAQPPLVHRSLKVTRLVEDNVREGFLAAEDYRRMLDLLPPHQQLVLVIGYHLGMRAGEILALRWDQVDWAAGVIRLEVKQTKGKQSRVAPLYGELRGRLELAYTSRMGDLDTIVSYGGRQMSEVGDAWDTARVKAGLPDLLVHDLRRTAVRNMVRAGIGEKDAMLISGHRTRSMFDRYNIIDERDILEAGRKLEVYHRAEAARGKKPEISKVRTKVRTVAAEAKTLKSAKGVVIQ